MRKCCVAILWLLCGSIAFAMDGQETKWMLVDTAALNAQQPTQTHSSSSTTIADENPYQQFDCQLAYQGWDAVQGLHRWEATVHNGSAVPVRFRYMLRAAGWLRLTGESPLLASGQAQRFQLQSADTLLLAGDAVRCWFAVFDLKMNGDEQAVKGHGMWLLNDDPVFDTVFQIEADFRGGPRAWAKFIQENLDGSVAAKKGAKVGDYNVIARFKVDPSGAVTEVNCENDPGFGTCKEVIRMLKKSPRWIPAFQNGKAVPYHQRQSVTFQVSE